MLLPNRVTLASALLTFTSWTSEQTWQVSPLVCCAQTKYNRVLHGGRCVALTAVSATRETYFAALSSGVKVMEESFTLARIAQPVERLSPQATTASVLSTGLSFGLELIELIFVLPTQPVGVRQIRWITYQVPVPLEQYSCSVAYKLPSNRSQKGCLPRQPFSFTFSAEDQVSGRDWLPGLYRSDR